MGPVITDKLLRATSTTDMTSNCKLLILAFALLAVANATVVFTARYTQTGCPADKNPGAVHKWTVGTCTGNRADTTLGDGSTHTADKWYKVTLSGSTYSYQEYTDSTCATAGRSDTAFSAALDTCIDNDGCCVGPGGASSMAGAGYNVKFAMTVDMHPDPNGPNSADWDCTSGACVVYGTNSPTNSASHATVGAIATLIGLVANLFVY